MPHQQSHQWLGLVYQPRLTCDVKRSLAILGVHIDSRTEPKQNVGSFDSLPKDCTVERRPTIISSRVHICIGINKQAEAV